MARSKANKRQRQVEQVSALILEAAVDPALSVDGLTVALGRALLLQIAQGGAVGAASVADILSGAARLKASGGGVDPVKELLEWQNSVPTDPRGSDSASSS